MQLNSLTLNSNRTSAQNKSYLAIYDHKSAIINTQIFVYGKTIQNFSIQTPLHKINIQTFRVQPVFTLNTPVFEDFMMFSFEQSLYFWGKTSLSQKNQLYKFDGCFDDCKFIKLDQIGPIPKFQNSFSYTIFSHQYVLVFGSLIGNQLLNKWYILDIKKCTWKQMVSSVQIPICQKSSLIWKNGRGYLLLQSAYQKNQKGFQKNILYEVKLKNFNKLILQCTQICLSPKIKDQNIIFTEIISFGQKCLMILGGQQTSMINENNQKTLNYDYQKIVYKIDLELFQWSDQKKVIQLKGQNFNIVEYKNQIICIGGVLNEQLIKQIQYYDFRSYSQKRRFLYEQSLCYYCQCAYTYDQKLIYEPIVEKQYESFCPKNRIQNKFLRKYSQIIDTEIHAIGMLCQFLWFQNCQQIKINLCQQIQLHQRSKHYKEKIQSQKSQILVLKGKTLQYFEAQSLGYIFQDKSSKQPNTLFSKELQLFYFHFTKLKLASFKLGFGFLYVTSTFQGEAFVGYCSYSQTDFPEPNFRSFSQTFYSIKIHKKSNKPTFSSLVKRQIIFQNVKMYFGNPEDYQNSNFANLFTKKGKQKNQVCLYVIGVVNLEISFYIEPIKNKYSEDIRIKSLNMKNSSNSLRSYLRHFYLTQTSNLNIFLQNKLIQPIKIYDKFKELGNLRVIKQISTNQQISNKTELEQTHFSTNQDEIIINWKKIEVIQKCKLYEVNKNKENFQIGTYSKIFIYRDKKLIRTISTRKQLLCGVIQLIKVEDVLLNETDLLNKSHERKIHSWILQIQNSLVEESSLSAQQF